MEGEETCRPAEASRVLGLSGRKISERRILHMLQAREPKGKGNEGGRWRILRRAVHRLLTARGKLE
jgi:hypothetical protein